MKLNLYLFLKPFIKIKYYNICKERILQSEGFNIIGYIILSCINVPYNFWKVRVHKGRQIIASHLTSDWCSHTFNRSVGT